MGGENRRAFKIPEKDQVSLPPYPPPRSWADYGTEAHWIRAGHGWRIKSTLGC
jgi:hypothetical protein